MLVNSLHRSVDALRAYERVSEDQRKVASRILTARDPNTDFNTVVKSSSTTDFFQGGFTTIFCFGQLHGCTIGTINVNILASKHTGYQLESCDNRVIIKSVK